ncbi:hypothetical protein E2C01_060461 [Portunus trituberculatus]|uniref:Uncharacterized protein n=1 Tax=Portunus trituberculatus TaxID=210409 RepID=A0A5B7H9I6_PORTR|nr:hypothetical protein [Portunus trituberculatus]
MALTASKVDVVEIFVAEGVDSDADQGFRRYLKIVTPSSLVANLICTSYLLLHPDGDDRSGEKATILPCSNW